MTLSYGPIKCISGEHEGRIGYYDNEYDIGCDECLNENCKCNSCLVEECDDCDYELQCDVKAVVYWGDMLLSIAAEDGSSSYDILNFDDISDDITIKDLHNRIDVIENSLFKSEDKISLLVELNYVYTLFYEKHIESRFSNKQGVKLFISHTSADHGMANLIYADLCERGHDPWLDDVEIYVGESIPNKILQALENTDFLILLLSKKSVENAWVKNEWMSIYMNQINAKNIKILPILLEDCPVPPLLNHLRYADFQDDYNGGFRELLKAIER